jgi:hypothetical protein
MESGLPAQSKNLAGALFDLGSHARSDYCFSLPLPSPPAEQATARQYQTRQAGADNGAGNRGQETPNLTAGKRTTMNVEIGFASGQSR